MAILATAWLLVDSMWVASRILVVTFIVLLTEAGSINAVSEVCTSNILNNSRNNAGIFEVCVTPRVE